METFIFYAAEMKDTMDDDTMKFIVISATEFLCIGTNGVHADVDIATEEICLTIVKAYVIGIVVVVDKFTVDLQNRFIIHKDEIDIPHPAMMRRGHLPYPGCNLRLVYLGQLGALCVVSNQGYE